MTLCIYHANCNDGFGAAWALHRKIPDAEFFAAQYGQEPPLDLAEGEDVYVVDFSYKYEPMLELAGVANKVIVLDHHKTSQVDLEPLFHDYIIFGNFDRGRSGAVLTWDYFFDEDAPLFLQYIQDRDLWTKALPYTDEISAWIYSLPKDFDKWSSCVLLFDALFDEYKEQGAAILRNNRMQIDNAKRHWHRVSLDGYVVPAAHTTVHFSEVAGELHTEIDWAPFGAAYFLADDGQKIVFSLRSRDDGADVSEVAKHYGGGGHRNAAGCQVTLGEFMVIVGNGLVECHT